ncbi:MAG: chemotaxis protein MotB [Chlamydiales bacterium]|jgi:chemotaxis protein MotB
MEKKPKKQEEPPLEGAPEWITTFVDMISLLVTFFILLFTFSSTEEYMKFPFPQELTGSRGTIEDDHGASMTDPPENDTMSAMHPTRGGQDPHTRPPDALLKNSEEMGQRALEGDIEFDPLSARDGIVMHFEESACFKPGDATVNSSLRRSLTQMAGVMQHYPNPIVIEGHTDSEFKPSSRYPTAEALSCARAVAAAEILMASSNISPKRLQVAGLGSTAPLNTNSTARERTRNRRIEVRIWPAQEASSVSRRMQRD